jgi:GNAT superfamily N-acetyltransferase
MSSDVDELVRLSGWAIPKMLAPGPGRFSRAGDAHVLALSGEPAADLNMLVIGADPEPEQVLREAADEAGRRDLPLLALFLPACADRLEAVAGELGFVYGGTFPLMALAEPKPAGAGSGFRIEPVGDARTRAIAADLQARGFGLERAAMARLLDESLALERPPQVFIASLDGEPMSTVTATPEGADVGIWTMATPPEHQGKGAGRALLGWALEHYRGQGVRRFYLYATEAGQPLYRSLGFETVAPCAAWVKGTSSQVAASVHG